MIQFLIPSNFKIEHHFLFKILASIALSICVRMCVCVCTDTDAQKNQIPGKEHVFYVCCVLCLLGYHEDRFVVMPFPLCMQFAAGCRMLWGSCCIVTKPELAEITIGTMWLDKHWGRHKILSKQHLKGGILTVNVSRGTGGILTVHCRWTASYVT